jgi:hypothetical protein
LRIRWTIKLNQVDPKLSRGSRSDEISAAHSAGLSMAKINGVIPTKLLDEPDFITHEVAFGWHPFFLLNAVQN